MGDPKDLPRVEDLPVLQIVPVEQPKQEVPPPPPADSWVWSWKTPKNSQSPN